MELCYFTEREWENGKFFMTHVYLFRIDLSLFDNLIECLAHF